ncbi:MAG: uroporphyrinogen decarboxylase family protein [Planctomycetota bacterium]|jgi:uroporphyrinogen decarboxylase
MTGRERVLAALRHIEGDRVPIDLGGIESSSLHADAYAALCALLGIDAAPRMLDVYQQVVLLDEPVRQHFGIDTAPMAFEPAGRRSDTTGTGTPILVPDNWRPEPLDNGDRVVRDAEGRIAAMMPRGGYYFDETRHPLHDVATAADVASRRRYFETIDKPAFLDEGWEAMARRARDLHTNTSLCIVGNLCVHILAAGQSLRGFENFMMDLVSDRLLAFAVMETLLEAYAPRIDTFAEKIAPWVDVILVNDDLGSQTGPLMSPDLYRATVKQFHARLFEYVRRRTGKPLLLHSCGSIHELIPDLMEIGVDAINPVQVSAADMDPAALKKEFGSDVTFWGGGCDTQNVLGRGSPGEVRDEVRRRIETLAPGGGFVFTQVHNIQPNVPPENIVAMLEAAAEFAAY